MSSPKKCSCQEAFEKLDDYLYRELSAEDLVRLEAHLCECIECAEAYQFEGRMLVCIKSKVSNISLPQDLADRVRAALDKCSE